MNNVLTRKILIGDMDSLTTSPSTSRDQEVKDEINRIMDKGKGLDKHQIFLIVSDKLNIPKPTVRRIARDLRLDMMKKLQVLQA
jgi:hypothetical protein